MEIYNDIHILVIIDKCESGIIKHLCYKYLENNIMSIEDYHNITKWFDKNNDKNIAIILHTLGGTVKSSDIISQIIKNTINDEISVQSYIPYYAHSAGTHIALMTDTIHMTKYSSLSPTDTQITFEHNGTVYSESTRLLLDMKKSIGNDIIFNMKINEAEVYHNDNIESLKKIFIKRIDPEYVCGLVDMFGSGLYPHEKPYDYELLKAKGLYVNLYDCDDAKDIIDNMDLFFN